MVVLFPAFFVLAGFSALVHGILQAQRTLRASRLGEADEGAFFSVERDPMCAGEKNRGAPWIVKYAFDANGQKGVGTLSTTEETARNLNKVGQPVWVLHLKNDLSQSTIYPPLR